MKRAIAIAALLVGSVVGMLAFDAPQTASANGGPHGDYTATTDYCAGCHRAHEALSSAKLLKQSDTVTLCTACHNGTGSRLDVLDGMRLDANKAARPAWDSGTSKWQVSTVDMAASAFEGTLNGGGFEFLGTITAGTPDVHVQNPVKSTHMDVTPNAATTAATATSDEPWGYAGTGATRGDWANGTATGGTDPTNTGLRPDVTFIGALACASCHNPHGNTNYRMLNISVNGYAVNVKAKDGGTVRADEGGNRGLEGTPVTGKYTQDYYYSGGQNLGATVTDSEANIASFCSACHTAYPSNSATTGLLANSVTHFRHKTEIALNATWVGCGSTCANATQNPEDGTAPKFTTKLRLADNATTANEVVTCLTCHRAHGSAASMSGNALLGTGTQGGGFTNDSSLLYLDNRGVCEVCHQW